MMTRIVKATPLALLVGIAGLIISFSQFSHEFEEDIGLGLLFKLRGPRPAPSDAVVISIDKESADQLKIPENPDKWPRSLHARLVETLIDEGAKVVTFDLHFIESRVPQDDKLFAQAINKAGNVVLADALTTREIPISNPSGSFAAEHSIVKPIKPLPLLGDAAVATAPFVLPRIPFKVNKYWTFQTNAGDSPTFPIVAYQLFNMEVYDDFVRLLEKTRPSLAGKLPDKLATATKQKGVAKLMRDIRGIFEGDPALERQMIDELERAKPSSAPSTETAMLKALVKLYGGSGHRYINYYGPPRTVHTIPFYQALQLGEGSDNRESSDLQNKVIFVGLSEKILAERKDSFYTVFSQANGVFIGGVEIAATAFLNMLEDKPVNPVGSQYYLLIIVLGGFIVGLICRMSSIIVAASSVMGLSVLYLLGASYEFKAAGTWFPIVIPLFIQAPLGFFGAVLWNYVETNKERQHIRKALAYYVPDEVVDQLAKNIVDIKNSGQMVYGACLFADVAGYTTLSEKLTPQQLSDLMHKYFEATFEPVKKHGGLVVNLKGDSFLAIWKAARAEAGLRRQACLAALDVAKAVHRFNDSYENLNLPTRVGVHSGQIFLGNIGAGDHYEYGPTGDTVNTASRMDGLNKYLGTEVLASEEIVNELDGVLKREVGKFVLKGKAQPIVVHELLGRLEETDEKQQKACKVFADGLAAFRNQHWDEAAEKFHRAIENSETDGPARFYIELCQQYKQNPPEEPWEGAIHLDEK
jgi:adenylate cyclase